MLSMLVRYWWMVALRGLLAVVFGVLALAWPGITLATLVLFFGVYSLMDGLFSIVAAMRQKERWAPLVLKGLLGVGVGILTFLWPGLTAMALLYLIAAWAIVTGVLEVVTAIRLRKVIAGEVLLVLSGLASVALGVLLAIWPISGALAMVWLLGVYALVFGALLLGLSIRLRAMHSDERAAARWHERSSGSGPGTDVREVPGVMSGVIDGARP